MVFSIAMVFFFAFDLYGGNHAGIPDVVAEFDAHRLCGGISAVLNYCSAHPKIL